MEIAAEDVARAQFYRLLARLLSRPASEGDLGLCRALVGDDSEIGRAIRAVAEAAREATPASVEREYHDLFIGLGRGELVPYGSYYLTGFLNEKPLARLRQSMAELGIERSPEVREPEDHIAAVCDMMGGLITGDLAPGAGLEEQKRFFSSHLAPWASHFFKDLGNAKTARFYAPVGALGRSFVEVEEAGFEMV
ncbi:TorD/DmsD family molecular chaperone [Lutibaculum baratangense]|uniref:Putative formate dehydrogenase-specific chaperone n=1 Tax=Lutibaculum baratangense AMV1 TaxID=631454 RepID=V4R9I5_9HYPH|nr:molecular chaperone TorD family protein [Lutibaculum baratangense]ESR22861.1 putative formate dehydrogenase-specific chaperone [Lutibaculum baratangense AMV1]